MKFRDYQNCCEYRVDKKETAYHPDGTIIERPIYYCVHWDRRSESKKCTQTGCKLY
jgi:hypothetical protein